MDYKNKYLKYKHKYLNLKNVVGGIPPVSNDVVKTDGDSDASLIHKIKVLTDILSGYKRELREAQRVITYYSRVSGKTEGMYHQIRIAKRDIESLEDKIKKTERKISEINEMKLKRKESVVEDLKKNKTEELKPIEIKKNNL